MPEQPMTYEASGVSISAQDAALAALKPAVDASQAAARFGRVFSTVGSFATLFQPQLDGLDEPLLVSSTDSLGTKALLHARFGTFEAAGRDLVAAVINDVVCCGAVPAFFLDYIGIHRVVPEVIGALVSGVGQQCGEIGCALVGGEIAEMRDVYKPDEFDLVGFGVGLVDRRRMLGAERVQPGDVLIGLASNGVHANGFTLVRRVLAGLDDAAWREPQPELQAALVEVLLRPTRCYATAVAQVQSSCELHAAAHISGGGLTDNLPRILPEGLCAHVQRAHMEIPPIFAIIQRRGHIPETEMWHVFNMGVGFVLVAPDAEAGKIIDCCENNSYSAKVIGNVAAEPTGPRLVWGD